MLLITAANGNQGKHLIPKLVAADVSFRACVASASSGRVLEARGVKDIIVGDLMDPDVLARAMRGVRTVYHIGPVLHPREREMGLSAIEAAKQAGVQHFVFSSVLHAIVTDLIQHQIKRDIEERLVSSGLEYTILQPTNYMLPLKLLPVFREDVFRLSWGLDRKQCMVDLDDITDVAVKVMTEGEAHWGATYELTGRGRHTAHDLGEIISRVMNRMIQVEQISADSYLKAVLGDVDPASCVHQAKVLRAITDYYSEHDFVGNSNVLTWLLGRAPTTFEQFVRREYQAFMRASSPAGG